VWALKLEARRRGRDGRGIWIAWVLAWYGFDLAKGREGWVLAWDLGDFWEGLGAMR